MYTSEDIEKVRQAIMRFQELLAIMQDKVNEGERAYHQLFSGVSAVDMANLREKDRQWKAAETLVADVTPLSKAVIKVRYDAREIGRALEELYNIIIAVPEPDDE